MMSFPEPIDKRSPARRFRDRDDPARAQANAGSEPRDPFWWSAVLATRAAFAARPGAKLISVPLDGGWLSVSPDGGWRASTPLPDDVAVQLDLYLPYCLSHPRGLAVAHIGQSLDGRIATENGESRTEIQQVVVSAGVQTLVAFGAPKKGGGPDKPVDKPIDKSTDKPAEARSRQSIHRGCLLCAACTDT